MLGGGHVRCQSIRSLVEASGFNIKRRGRPYDSPNKARIVEKPSIASTSYQFGGEQMIKTQRGVLERQSLELDEVLAVDCQLVVLELLPHRHLAEI